MQIMTTYLASRSVTSSFLASKALLSEITFSSVCFVVALSYSFKLKKGAQHHSVIHHILISLRSNGKNISVNG